MSVYFTHLRRYTFHRVWDAARNSRQEDRKNTRTTTRARGLRPDGWRQRARGRAEKSWRAWSRPSFEVRRSAGLWQSGVDIQAAGESVKGGNVLRRDMR